jgi:phosphate transport system substrate-binding protein
MSSLESYCRGKSCRGGDISGRDFHFDTEGNVHFQRLWWLIFVLALARIASSQNAAQVQLIGVGTTFPLPLYSVWWQAFHTTHPGISIKYLPYGSSSGIEMLASGGADFGASDAPMTDRQFLRGKALHFPTVLGAIVPIYNLPGVVEPLRFSPKALAGIYLGTITKWNDPAISGPNPEIQLPSSNIAVVHSAAGRGSTYIWSDYMTKVSVEWRTRVGRGSSVKWPVGTEAEGSGNVARMVKETSNSIGFVELAYAVQNRLPCGEVQNAAGNFITANSSSISAAAAASAKAMPSDFRASITNPSGRRSYPIASFTWILVSENMDSTKREAMKDFLRWMLDEGQTYAESAGFTRLPKAIVEPELRAVEEMP